MNMPDSLKDYYYHQGYNYVDKAPDGLTVLGGGCQAASLLIAARLLTDNPHLSMNNISYWAEEVGLAFHDKVYANRISYPTISVVGAIILPECKVRLYLKSTRDQIAANEKSTFYYNEANDTYLNMPRISNLSTEFGVDISSQIESMRRALEEGGVAIPLIHPDTLFGADNPKTVNSLHTVVVVGFNQGDESVRIIDPSPGFSWMPRFVERRKAGTLKIRANAVRKLATIEKIAYKFHPLKSVYYTVPLSRLEGSLGGCLTTIIPG